ncbi:hypothetical protein J2Y48_004237, partial [Mycoplana sp. BE70]|nr:hypothetical protein [Mycoplana sp. BE70]
MDRNEDIGFFCRCPEGFVSAALQGSCTNNQGTVERDTIQRGPKLHKAF